MVFTHFEFFQGAFGGSNAVGVAKQGNEFFGEILEVVEHGVVEVVRHRFEPVGGDAGEVRSGEENFVTVLAVLTFVGKEYHTTLGEERVQFGAVGSIEVVGFADINFGSWRSSGFGLGSKSLGQEAKKLFADVGSWGRSWRCRGGLDRFGSVDRGGRVGR